MRVFVRKRPVLAQFTLGAFMLLALILMFSFTVRASNGSNQVHLITIHDRDGRHVVRTEAQTVAEALEKANIQISDSDNVEPALDEEIVSANFSINIYRARPVLIVDGSVKTRILTAAQTDRTIADAAGIELYSEDVVNIQPTTNLLEAGVNTKLVIERATAVNVNFYGKRIVMRTQAETVGEFLDERELAKDESDFVSRSRDDRIVEGMLIEIWRNGKNTLTVEQDVPFSIEQVRDYDREVGYRRVKTPGENGKRTVVYEVEMLYGRELSRERISQAITKEPVNQVEIVGAKIRNTFNGSFAEALALLRMCESNDNYSINTGNGFFGAYQFDIQTWGNFMGFPNAAVAPPRVQDERAWQTYLARGWQPWPACSRMLGLQDIYR